ncbi:MAG: bifunctional proline dehydrogenase/L-glutamate gamma-semialdehyde dehydrogenase PutA [Burkholderiaceae bacterium]
MLFDLALASQTPLRAVLDTYYRAPEPECVTRMADLATEDESFRLRVRTEAARLVVAVRDKRARSGGVDALMREFSLSSEEGVALMCLAEALLRIPDPETRDALIRDKIGGGDWHSHLGRSPSLFVNAASWGLLITGKLIATHSARGLSSALARLIGRGGEPLIRRGVDLAMRMLGRQFVTGETIEEAIANGSACRARGYRYSYDMLGEAALTAHDAQKYFDAYENAIHAIGGHAGLLGFAAQDQVRLGPGISVKLSALHPRYSRAQRKRVIDELLPRLKTLARLARDYNIGLNIDAEESERLDLSLDLLEILALDSELAHWNGLGFVVQAYQKRAPYVIDWLIDLARRSQGPSERKLMIRLVKGAYWDSEIKRAQIDGQTDYPVYTRKVHTDVAYQACAKKLLGAADVLYPQFATHNAYTLAWVRESAKLARVRDDAFEFQCLHGMGETLYDQVLGQPDSPDLACRIYAPVGTHETLLAYLVRRLLENGANSSFVNRIVDESVSIDTLVSDPVETVRATCGRPHLAIPTPPNLYPDGRKNSLGFDWSSESALRELDRALSTFASQEWQAHPTTRVGEENAPNQGLSNICNPADHRDVVGKMRSASMADVEAALARSAQGAPGWMKRTGAARAQRLLACSDALEEHRLELAALAVREAGKSLGNALGEVREAVDFCRYYASQVAGLEEGTSADLRPIVCISPWNFPLAIFTGQVVAALAAGRCVLAKPAEQTPLIAARAVELFHGAGIPEDVLQIVPGDGTVGAALVAAPGIGGVLFTGSTEVARGIAATLTKAPGERVLVAETGGQNALIVDSSALAEQVVQDIVTSAFDSAGQRCSALRLLCVQEDVAESIVSMLKGAMAELSLGNPAVLACDIGPVIDGEAKKRLLDYIARMKSRGHRVTQLDASPKTDWGTFVAPTLIEIEAVSDLEGEVFGPVLHVLRYRFGEIESVVDAVNRTGYGLTMGVHSRVDEHIHAVAARAKVGNLYVNRNMVGAVVGVQPFGGEGLSGTGPKAGGPLYLARLGGPLGQELLKSVTHSEVDDAQPHVMAVAQRLNAWNTALEQTNTLASGERQAAALAAERGAKRNLIGRTCLLPGPTGENNILWFSPREKVACDAQDRSELLSQIAAVLACGGRPFASRVLLPESLREFVGEIADETGFDAVLVSGAAPERNSRWSVGTAAKDEPILPVIIWPNAENETVGLYRLFHERTVSTNTAAAGGNASLMTLED